MIRFQVIFTLSRENCTLLRVVYSITWFINVTFGWKWNLFFQLREDTRNKIIIVNWLSSRNWALLLNNEHHTYSFNLKHWYCLRMLFPLNIVFHFPTIKNRSCENLNGEFFILRKKYRHIRKKIECMIFRIRGITK